jgi:hypothetical protein
LMPVHTGSAQIAAEWHFSSYARHPGAMGMARSREER